MNYHGDVWIKKSFMIGMAFYIVSCLVAIYTNRFLYADGSLFFIQILNHSNSTWPFANDGQRMRLFINIFNQLPISILIKLGYTNINILRCVYGLSLFFQNIIGVLLVYRISKKSGKMNIFVFTLFTYTCFNIISEIFIINPAIFSFWIYCIVFLYATLDFEKNWFDKTLLVLSMIIETMSHEAIIIFAPMIAGVSAFKIIEGKSIKGRLMNSLIFLVSIGQSIYGIWWNKAYSTSEASGGYLEVLKNVLNLKGVVYSNLFISVLGLCLVIIYFKKEIKKYTMFILFIGGSLAIIYMQYTGVTINPYREYTYRSLITCGEILLFIIIFIENRFSIMANNGFNLRSFIIITMLILSLQSVWQIGNSMYWNKYISQFEAGIISSNEKEIEPKNIAFGSVESRFDWSWNQSVLSISLQKDYIIKKIVKPRDLLDYYVYNEEGLEVPFCRIDRNIFNYSELGK